MLERNMLHLRPISRIIAIFKVTLCNYVITPATFTTTWWWQKNKLFFIPTLLSLHSYHDDKIWFYYCSYVHYAMISTKNKLIFIPKLPSVQSTRSSVFSSTVRKLSGVLVFFSSGSSVFLKDSYMIHQFHCQELQWSLTCFTTRNLRSQNFDFLNFKNFSRSQFLGNSNSCWYNWILKLLVAT